MSGMFRRILFLAAGCVFLPGIADAQCDVLLRYDDGTDDTPGYASAGGIGGMTYPHHYVGIIATPPAGDTYWVQSASFFSDIWITPGPVTFQAREEDDPANMTTETLFVTGTGTWTVQFTDPICVDSDFSIMLCSDTATGGVGEDFAAPDSRSWRAWSPDGCQPVLQETVVDWMIWTCVTPCSAVATPENSRGSSTWGRIKSLYR